MRTSLIEIERIEEHLNNRLSAEDEMLFQAHLVLNEELRMNVQAQEESYRLITAYGRSCLKNELDEVYKKLMTASAHKSFSQKLCSLFRR